MKVNITYDNSLAALAEKFEEQLGVIMEAAAQAVCDSAKSMCPVDTGALRSSINVSVNGNRAEISADTDYASYVEFGTSKMAPRPYLVPALLQNREAIITAAADVITDM